MDNIKILSDLINIKSYDTKSNNQQIISYITNYFENIILTIVYPPTLMVYLPAKSLVSIPALTMLMM